MKHEIVDAVVVGAGAGGGCVAKTLAVAGIQTMLLERGEWAKGDVYGEDDLSSQRAPILTRGPGPLGARTRHWHFHDNFRFGVVKPLNAACVGSGTVTYGAMGWRFLETDFKLKTHYGEIPDSSVEDWPISYHDLEPFYEQAEYEIGVAGSNEGNPFAAPRHKPFPMPPFHLNREAQAVFQGGKKLGLHPFPVPTLRNSIPYNGRGACIHQRACVGFRCPIDAKCGTQNTVIPVALASDNCQLRICAMVTELLVNDRGCLRGVKYVDENDEVHEVLSKIVVLACGSNGTARLLMTSHSKLFPNGAGNNQDVVGRNICDHAYVAASGFMKDDMYEEAGPGCGVAFMDFNHDNPGFICGGVLHTDFQLTPYQFSGMRLFKGDKGWGMEHKNAVRKYFKKRIFVAGPHQQTPRWENRLVLDTSKKDYWGLPDLKTAPGGYEHPNDAKARTFMVQKAREILAAAGAVEIFGGTDSKPRKGWGYGGQHQSGSCRMGTDPKKSVCTSWGRVWDFPNLFVSDGSLHVNNGGMNPVLTIMALGFRVGQGIVQNRKELGI